MRKPTYIVRKEEKESLLKEIEQLQAKLKAIEDGESQRESMLHEEIQTTLLRTAVQQQQLSLVNTQSAVSAYVCAQDALPYEATIHLSNDFTQRRDALIAAKERILLASLDYSTARTRFVDPFRPFSERSRYLLDSGDYCSLQIDQVSLMLPHSTVREVFDTIMENHSNIDMRITDVFGDITTCDETNYGVEGIRQSRFASGLACGVSVEMNVANFFHYFEHMHDERGGGPVGVFASDFVDRDDLYPYQSAERVRYDITGVLVVRKHRKTRRNPVTGEDEEVSAIVLTQSCLFKIRRPLMQLSPGVEYQLRDQLGQWGRVMMSAVLDTAHGINQPFQ